MFYCLNYDLLDLFDFYDCMCCIVLNKLTLFMGNPTVSS